MNTYWIERILWTKWKEHRISVDHPELIRKHNLALKHGDYVSASYWFDESLDILLQVFVTLR